MSWIISMCLWLGLMSYEPVNMSYSECVREYKKHQKTPVEHEESDSKHWAFHYDFEKSECTIYPK